jgi:hypothetical protein
MKLKFTLCYLAILSSLFTNAQQLNSNANKRLVIDHEEKALAQFRDNIYIHTDKDIYEPGEDVWFKAYILDANELIAATDTKNVFMKFSKLEADSLTVLASEYYEANNGFAHGDFFLNDTLHNGTYQLEIYTKGVLESASNKMRAVKQFQIVDNIIPKILMDAEFSQKTYRRDEAIEAEVMVFSRDRAPYRNATVIAQLFSGSKRIARTKYKTDDNGIIIVKFPAEKSKIATDLKLRVRFEGIKGEHNIEIPFAKISNVHFGMYPEGGNLVKNLPNTVAFKALDPNGRPVAVEGNLYEDGQKIQSFSAAHFGMGSFQFTPKANREYSVKLANLEIDSVYKLPKILPEGIKLQVAGRTENHINFSVTRSKNMPAQQIYIRAQNRGLVYWMATASLEKEQIAFNLPLEEFPQGIVEITIFDENLIPLAERLMYTNLNQKLHITLKELSKKTFRQKDKVSLTFEVKDQYQNPVIANFSLSVHDHLYDNKSNHYAMMPHYYLFSELKGHVYNASYYFDPQHKNREAHLDLLMLTQGWRSYVWNTNNFETATEKRFFIPEIQGKAYIKTTSGILRNAAKTDLQIISTRRLKTIQTDKAGLFKVDDNYVRLLKGEKMMFSASSKEVIVELYDHFEKIDAFTKDKEFLFPKSDRIKTQAYSKSYDSIFTFDGMNYLDEVILIDVKARQKERNIYRITEIPRFPPSGITEYPGKEGDFLCKFLYLNCGYHQRGPKPEDKRIYRMPKTNELIFYRAPILPEKKVVNKNFTTLKGMYLTKQFYVPTYDSKDHELIPDPRKTLLWAPNLTSNEKGELTVTFYTSDVQSTFLGRLEGTDGNGLLGANIFKFDVR